MNATQDNLDSTVLPLDKAPGHHADSTDRLWHTTAIAVAVYQYMLTQTLSSLVNQRPCANATSGGGSGSGQVWEEWGSRPKTPYLERGLG